KNAMVNLWLGLGTKNTWLWSGKDHVFGIKCVVLGAQSLQEVLGKKIITFHGTIPGGNAAMSW
ncbi:hypothetical protein P7M41_26225, partial [Vibrio parahaemolyticus]|nr:hypothetical protein [Vibrio parahaemolyticus]